MNIFDLNSRFHNWVSISFLGTIFAIIISSTLILNSCQQEGQDIIGIITPFLFNSYYLSNGLEH